MASTAVVDFHSVIKTKRVDFFCKKNYLILESISKGFVN